MGRRRVANRLTPQVPWHKHVGARAGMVKWYHTSLPSSWCGFDSRYPLQTAPVDLLRLVTTSRLECRMVEEGTEWRTFLGTTEPSPGMSGR